MTPTHKPRERTRAFHVHGVTYHPAERGYQFTCTCGWKTGISQYLERIGQEFDQHMREEGVLK
jgi:hypothetical protein